MEFRTTAGISPSSWSISLNSRLLMLGSCFADNIGSRLADRLFNVSVNPTGTLYNPASIHSCVKRFADGRPFTPADIFRHGELYHCFECHSRLSDTDADRMLIRLNDIIELQHKRLASTDTVILTFGTSWVFETADTGTIVANCHKLPAERFHRRCLNVNESFRYIVGTINAIASVAPDAKIILTVSPVRHLADGLHGNQLSKATLLLAVERAVQTFSQTVYFPAYELLVDDLRDYRFYAADMTHPSETAADYVYERFSETFFTPATTALAARCAKLTRRMRHRQLTADDNAMNRFETETRQAVSILLAEAPFLSEAIDNIIQK